MLRHVNIKHRCRWPRDLRRGSAATRLLGLRFLISLGARMLSGRGLCDGPIPRPEVPYRGRVCVIGCNQVNQVNNNPLHVQLVGRNRSD